MTSPDGVDWTVRTSVPDINWWTVAWGDGTFVAVAEDGAGDRVMTSPDGVNWTTRGSAAAVNWRSVTWGDDTFVAVASSGAGDLVMTSPDGATWTARTAASADQWRSVTWGGPAGSEKFVAVASSGPQRVMTSPDGVTWTARTAASTADWFGITWGGPPGHELFVAVAGRNIANANVVMTSPDGVNWTLRQGAVANEWMGVTWGGPSGRGKFAAVARNGTGDRVMTSSPEVTCYPVPPPPAISPSSQVLAGVVGVPVSPTSTFTMENFTLVPRFVMYPPLPAGLSMDPASGVVSGTPTEGYPSTRHWITATAGGNAESAFSTLDVSVAAGVPSAPREVTAVPGDSSAVVSWRVPESDGGSPVTGYTATASPGGESCTTTGELRCDITGLTNGTTYSVQVVATNSAGQGSSGQGGLVTPRTVPSAPREVSATAGDRAVVVSWRVPESDGGAEITGYVVTASPGDDTCETTGLSCEVTGLANGTAYSIEVVATNAAGQGPAGLGGPVTPRARAQVVVVTGVDSTPLPASIVARQALPVLVMVTNSRGEVVAGERVEVTVSGDATLPEGAKSVEVTTDGEGRALVSVVAGDVGEFFVSATAAEVTSRSDAITITPAPSITVVGSGRETQDRRRVFVDLQTKGIPAGSELRTWIVKGEGCLAEPGRVVVTAAEGSAAWSRRARAALTVWFTQGEVTSDRVTLPALVGNRTPSTC